MTRPLLLLAALLLSAPADAQNLISTGASSGLRLYMTNGNDFWLDPTNGTALIFKVNGVPVSTMTAEGFWLVNGINSVLNTGLTASSITTTVTGNTQYSVRASSGINVLAGGVVAPFFNGTYVGDGSRLSGVLDNSKLLKAGDTMTGALDVAAAASFGLGAPKSTFTASPGGTEFALQLSSGVRLAAGILQLGAGGFIRFPDGSVQTVAGGGGGGSEGNTYTSSKTFTAAGATQYSVQTSSGITVVAGPLNLGAGGGGFIRFPDGTVQATACKTDCTGQFAGTDPYSFCDLTSCKTGNCDGAGNCAYVGSQTDPNNSCAGVCTICGGGASCVNTTNGTDPMNDCDTASCRTGSCNGSGACAFVTSQTDPNNTCAGVCTICGGGAACVNTTNGTDPTNDCDTLSCRTGNCDGAGACAFVTAQTDPNNNCGSVCTVCGGGAACVNTTNGTDPMGDCGTTSCQTGNCNGAGACAFVAAQTDPNNNCAGLCTVCGGASTCVNTTAGTDPVNDCAASACTNTGMCNGAGACTVPSAGTDPNNFCPNTTCMDVNCNGAGACQFVPNGVQGQNCTAAQALCSEADTCNGAGTCLANTTPAATYGPGCNVGTHGGCAACNGAEGGCQWYSLCGNWGSCSGGLHCTSTGACIADTGGTCD